MNDRGLLFVLKNRFLFTYPFLFKNYSKIVGLEIRFKLFNGLHNFLIVLPINISFSCRLTRYIVKMLKH